ncbi:YidB family protein [Zoogloea sp.]|uniref:YidB family protein n=1 Tax=Zoogloea sp. TaxID=49181 RepID=UPI00260DAFDB|nr:YidB family protein [uncultured Zoogloea sp.]
MGLLDQLAGQVLGSLAGGDGQQQGGGAGQALLLQLAMSLLQGQGGVAAQGGQLDLGGILGGLVARFGEAGLAEQASSWVGTGQNLPVSAEQIGQVFGNSALGDMAAQLGMPSEQVAGHLANLLPQVIDGLTPGGQLPAAGGADLGDALAGLAAMFGRG